MDTFEVDGIKAKLETLAAKIFEEKITEGSIRELFEKINIRYTDKRAADVFKELKEFFGKCYMMALNMEKEANEKQNIKQDKPEQASFARRRFKH